MSRVLVQLHRGRGLIATLIRWQQRSQYAHASIMIDGTVYEALARHGVVRRAASDYEAEYRAGTIVQAPVALSESQRYLLGLWLEGQVGKRYDWLSVARFVSRRRARTDGRWFCSELVVAGLAAVGVQLFANTEPWEVSPGLLGRTPILDFRGLEP